MPAEELDKLMNGESEEDNFRLYANSEQFYFSTIEEAKIQAEKYKQAKTELRIEFLIETAGADFWAFDYRLNDWVPS